MTALLLSFATVETMQVVLRETDTVCYTTAKLQFVCNTDCLLCSQGTRGVVCSEIKKKLSHHIYSVYINKYKAVRIINGWTKSLCD